MICTSVTMQGGSRQTPMNSTTLGWRMADMMATCIEQHSLEDLLSVGEAAKDQQCPAVRQVIACCMLEHTPLQSNDDDHSQRQ